MLSNLYYGKFKIYNNKKIVKKKSKFRQYYKILEYTYIPIMFMYHVGRFSMLGSCCRLIK